MNSNLGNLALAFPMAHVVMATRKKLNTRLVLRVNNR